MINEKRLLQEAHTFFAAKEYDKALFLYSQISSLYPQNQEYQMYAVFCDIASENEEKAIALHDYFAVAKSESLDVAIKTVENIINAYDGDQQKMMDILKDISVQVTQSLDAIEYQDFKKLVENRGSFREAFEDIMFSTKVAIENKEDFFDFVSMLIDNDFNTTAYNYLDGFNKYFTYDKKIEELYKKLERKSIDSKTQQS